MLVSWFLLLVFYTLNFLLPQNNSCKLAKWTIQAMLSGAEGIKLGYVSRVQPKDKYSHVILGLQTYTTQEFARQINLSSTGIWGVFLGIVRSLRKLSDGKYVILKDPNKAVLRVYRVPDSFDEDDDDADGGGGATVIDGDDVDDEGVDSGAE